MKIANVIKRFRQRFLIKPWIRIILFLRFGYAEQRTIRWKEFLLTENRNGSCIPQIMIQPESFENDILCISRHIHDNNPIFFDVGANIGIITLLLSRIHNCEIYAFEPGNTGKHSQPYNNLNHKQI